MAYLYLALAFCFNGLANILLKAGAAQGIALGGGLIAVLGKNWRLLLGVALFAGNVPFYFLALRTLPLSTAYPVMVAASFLIVNGYAFFALTEPMTLIEVAGYVLIILGLVLVVAHPS